VDRSESFAAANSPETGDSNFPLEEINDSIGGRDLRPIAEWRDKKIVELLKTISDELP
jgi:hypothetical protein